MADSGFRLLLMLQKIPREPRSITTQQLLQQLLDDGYEVTLRTVQRDLVTLSAHFAIFQTEPTGKGKTGIAWAFRKDSKHTGIPLMDTTAALTLLMSIDYLQRILPPQVLEYLQPLQMEAAASLQTMHKGAYAQWIDKVRVVPQQILQPPSVDALALQDIYTALLEKRQFSASYKGKKEQIIHPYGLVQRGGTLYLLCRFFDFDDVRITALHRFSNTTLLNKTIRPFPTFNIDDYLNKGAMQWPVNDQAILLQLRIDRWLMGHLAESPLSSDQVIEPDNHDERCYTLQANMLDSHELRWWLLSQGDSLEVLAPTSLRNWFAKVASNMHRYYAE